MKNKAIKSLGFLTVASLISTSALAQVTVSGYVEAGFLTGNNQGARTANSQGVGGETVITVMGKGKLSNGWEYMAYQNLDSDEATNGRNVANASPMTTRAIEISPSKDFKLFYSFDGVYGGEIARTAVPTVTERVADMTGATGISEFIDVTSGGHSFGFDVLNAGPAGRFSVAYNPNLDSNVQSSSDRISSGTGQTANSAAASGYSVGYSVQPGPVKVALGYTKIDQQHASAAKDATSRTGGVTYIGSGFAAGVQRTKNDGTKTASLTTLNMEDTVDTAAFSFAANKEITVGGSYSKMGRTVVGQTAGPDLKVLQAVIAYNLGPVVASISYEDSRNLPMAGTSLDALTTSKNMVTASGIDSTLTKLKVKANF
jgi:hypothetical protein